MLAAAVFLFRGNEEIEEPPVVNLTPASEILNPDASIDFYETLVRKEPDNVSHKLGLAQVYLQQARETRQEAVYLPRLERMLEEILDADPRHYQALALQASYYNTLHEFEKARDIALDLIARNDRYAYVYGVLVDALVELGEYEEAVRVCDEMISIRPGLASYARASYLRELHGDGEGAMEAMRLAADAGVAGTLERSWALYQLGQLYLGESRPVEAMQVFKGILEERPGYAFAYGGLAQVKRLEGAYDEAIALFEKAYALVPAEEFLEGLADIYETTGDNARFEDMMRAIENGYKEADDFGENVRMEYADLLADLDREVPKALELAEMEVQRRPGHLHALETYAWALHKSGRSAEAIPYVEEAMRLNTGDAMVHYRAARIYAASDRIENAIHQLEQALEANLHVESLVASKQAAAMLDGLYAGRS